MSNFYKYKVLITQILAGVIGLSLVTTLVLRTSSALFSDPTDNGTNSWATGSVTLDDDDSGTAMFTTAGDGLLTGGQIVEKCITTTYTGTYTSGVSVKLYGTATGSLAPYLTLKVEQGTGGAFGDCTGFSGSQIYSNTLDNFSTNVNSFTNGVGSWAPSANPSTQTYRFTITVSGVVAAQGKSASGTFTWEAQA